MEEKAQQIHKGATRVEHTGHIPLYKATLFTDCVRRHRLHSHIRIVFVVYPFSIRPIVIATCIL